MTDKKKNNPVENKSSQDVIQKEIVTQEGIVKLLRERKAEIDSVTQKYKDAYHSMTGDYAKNIAPDVFAGTVFELKDEFKKDNRRNKLADKVWFNYVRLIHFSNPDGTIDDSLLVMVHGWYMDGVNCIKWDKKGMGVDEFHKRYVKAADQTYVKQEDVIKDDKDEQD